MGIIKTYQNGSFLWEYATDLICATGRDLEDSWQISDVYTDNHGVYFVADCKLYALDILSGHLKWTVDDVGN